MLAVGLLLAACGGGDEASDAGEGARPASSGGGAPAADAAPAPQPAEPDEPTDPADGADPAWAEVELPEVAVGTDVLGGATEPTTGAGWTVLYYGIADTDLEPFLMGDVDEMGEVGTGPGLNVVGLLDRSPDYGDDPVLDLGAWAGAKLVEIGAGTGTVLADLGDLNTGDPQTLADFITTGVANYPADQYALVISDHGAAWPGVGPDESSGFDVMDVPELYAGIRAGLDGAGIDQLDLLGFDACLMATYEVASTLAPVARRMLASQELEPGHGWDYASFQVLRDAPDTDVDTLGRAIVDGFAEQARSSGTDSDITLSLVDLDQIGALDAAVADFTSALAGRASALGPAIGQTRAKTLSFGRSPDPEMDTHMTDLGILVSEIGVAALDVSDQADALVRALNDTVLYTVEGQATSGATGLSVYFPPRADYFSQSYTYLPGSYHWSSLLEAYYSAGAAIPTEEQPQFTETEASAEGGAEVFFDEDGLNIVGTFDAATTIGNIAMATVEYGTVLDDGSIVFFGSEPATVLDDGSGSVLGIYDLTTLVLTDGADRADAYLELVWEEGSEIGTIDVPMAYYPPGTPIGGEYEDVLLSLVFDGADEGSILSETYYTYDSEAGTYGELWADPEALLVPQLYLYGSDGTGEWVPTTDVGLWADLPNLLYEFPTLESGTPLYVQLTVTDFGGNSDSVSALVEVP